MPVKRGEPMKKYFVPLFFVLLGCGEHSFDNIFDDIVDNVVNKSLGTGLLSPDNIDIIPQDIKSFSTASLPPSVSLEDKFPPVQNQGQYGTCTVWATGYALKTALNAIDKNWTPADLAKPQNQTSPKDLWLMIPPARFRGENCYGSVLEFAMDALIASGAASMKDVPYDMANSCNNSPSSAKGDPNNKLANYRKIAVNGKLLTKPTNKVEGMEVDNFKSYLAQGRPVLFGARLGDRFKYRRDDKSVLYSDYNNNSMGHAMVLVGYDDNMGDNGAFRVRNSWGTDWGDNGGIWVDYNFFVTDFLNEAYVAQNPNSPEPNPNPPANIIDLLTSFAEDYQDPEKPENPRARLFSYEVYNNGSMEILAKQRWGVYYMYYNAYDAEEYELIYEDYYTDEHGKPCTKPGDLDNEVCYGKKYPTNALAGGYWNNMNVKPGKMAGEAEASNGFEMPYIMPSITGDYYLVVYADYEDVIKESNEDNNFYFITADGGKPLQFENGVMKSEPMNSKVLSKRARTAPVHSVVDLGELNAYTPKEIKTLLSRDKKNGIFAKKVAKYREKKTNPVKRIKKQ